LLSHCICRPSLARGRGGIESASDLVSPSKKSCGTSEALTKVKLPLGSFETFSTQIENGAPFDVFLSAGTAYPQDVEKKGLTTFIYAVGRIVMVWVPKNPRYADPNVATVGGILRLRGRAPGVQCQLLICTQRRGNRATFSRKKVS